MDSILDNYQSVEEIQKHGQRIFYSIDAQAGHLAIFVGTKIAAKNHAEFINNMELIDAMPPGLYEIVITEKPGAEASTEGEDAFEICASRSATLTTFAHWGATRSRTSASLRLSHAFQNSTTPSIRVSFSLGSR